MPLAMAALDVAGAIRERSPTDMALFGEAAARLADRFLTPDAGLALLARAVSDGNAEAEAWLVTAVGQQRFRVSLWRQRGGERIRVLAAFAACELRGAQSGADLPGPDRATVLRIGADMRAPLEAMMGFAEALRSGSDDASSAADIIAAAWRLRRLSNDLLAAGAAPDGQPPFLAGEVDIARLVRRIIRLAVPAARAAGVEIGLDDLPEAGKGPLVLGDDGGLWGAIEALLGNAIRHAGQGAAMRVSMAASALGQVLEIAGTGPGVDAERLAELLEGGGGLVACRAALRANGAGLELGSSPERGFTARITFPAARCLSPV